MNKNPFTGERAWFPAARFGIFFHFGLYTLLEGNESQYRNWDRKNYAKLMEEFNPVDFNADAWVKLAKDNGAKYIVPTTKHGEGFCLWDSATTRFKVTNTPFNRDIIRELSEACQRHGVRFCIYYAMDSWLEECEHQPGSFPELVVAQVRELVTDYGQVNMVWFDGASPAIPRKRMQGIVDMIHELQPSAVVNDRGIKNSEPPTGDFVTPERHIPEVYAKHPFIECCDAMGLASWGYDKNGRFWSSPELVRRLSRASSLGGNYLLNVEPDKQGVIRPECVERLQAIGNWLKTNGDAIYDIEESKLAPVDPTGKFPEIGVCTQSVNKVYLHLHQWPKSSAVMLKHVSGKIKQAKILGSDCKLGFTDSKKGILLTGLPPEPPSRNPAIIRIEFNNNPVINNSAIKREDNKIVKIIPDEIVYLRPETADRRGPDGIRLARICNYPNGAVTIGAFSLALRGKVIWHLQVEQPGEYEVFMDLGTSASQAGASFSISVDNQIITGVNSEVGICDVPKRIPVGKILFTPGNKQLVFKILKSPFSFSDIHAIILKPCPSVK